MKQTAIKEWIPPPEAFILDKYEQQIENDVAKDLYIPISKEEFFLKLKSWEYHKTNTTKKTQPAIA
jgi:hypothetical protein